MSPRRRLDAAAVTAAALELADAEGLGSLTLAGVAARLGVRAPSLYNHVDGLDDLRRRLAVRAVGLLGDALADAIAGRAGHEAVRELAGAYRRFAHERPGAYAATLRAPAAGDAEHEAATARVLALLRAALRGLELAPADEVHAIRALRSALHGFTALEAAGGFELPVERDASFGRLVDVLLAGLATARG